MNRLGKILEQTLDEIEVTNPPTLGITNPSATDRSNFGFSPEIKDKFLLQLEKEAAFNNKMIITMFIAHLLVLGLATFLVIYFLGNPQTIVYLFGGSIFTLMGINYSLIQIWRAKIANDNLRIILPNLPPDQAIEVIKSIYFALQKNKQ